MDGEHIGDLRDDAIGLFQRGDFTLASGQRSSWKIECDALTPSDWDGLAAMLADRLPYSFSVVVGVPRGGIPFEKALTAHIDLRSRHTLVVDDVWTTGGSMARFIENQRGAWYMLDQPHMRAVAFARNPVPADVTAVFYMARVSADMVQSDGQAQP